MLPFMKREVNASSNTQQRATITNTVNIAAQQ